MSLVAKLDKFLLLFGNQLAPRSRKIKILNNLIKLCFYAYYANLFSYLLTRGHVDELVYSIYMFFNLAAHTWIFTRRKQITKLLNQINRNLSPQFKHGINNRWRKTLVILFVYYLLDVISSIYYSHTYPQATFTYTSMVKGILHVDIKLQLPSLIKLIVHWIVLSFADNVWCFGNFLIYNYVVFCVHLVHEAFFAKLENLKLLQDRKEIDNLRKEWKYIIDIRDDFEANFSFLPLIWYFNIFVRGVNYIFKLSNQGIAINLINILTVYWFLSKLLFTFSVLFTVSNVNSNLRKMFKQFDSKTLLLENAYIDKLKQEIEKNLLMKFTAYEIFNLDKNLVLSFISALVTFAILFQQLVGTQISF